MSKSQLLSSCCYLFTVFNSGLLSLQRPRPASHAHGHRQPYGLNSSIYFFYGTVRRWNKDYRSRSGSHDSWSLIIYTSWVPLMSRSAIVSYCTTVATSWTGERWPASSKYVAPWILLPRRNNVSVKSARAVNPRFWFVLVDICICVNYFPSFS